MPNSLSLPFNLFLHKNVSKEGTEYTTILPPAEMRQVLEEAIGPEEVEDVLSGQRSVVTSCGSGMTAGVLWLGLQLLGAKKVALYDEVSCSFILIECHIHIQRVRSRGQDTR